MSPAAVIAVRQETHLVGQRALGRGVADELAQPGDEGVPGLEVAEVVGLAAHLLDLVDVDGLQERLARREVAVQRADADTCATRDVLQRGGRAVLGEDLAGGGQQVVVVAPGVGALGALGEPRDVGVRGGGV
jgi:hypothetical protein